MAESRESLMKSALEACAGNRSRDLGDLFTDDVIGWSPNLSVASRAELALELAERDTEVDELQDALSEVVVTIDSIDNVGAKTIAEWRLAARHTGPLALDEATIVAPTGRRITLAGATFAEFRAGRICVFRSYFDDAALLEQLLVS